MTRRFLSAGRLSMAQLVYGHPSASKYRFHVFTDLDFWDARRILKDVALVKRNFGHSPPGDFYPTQVVSQDAGRVLAAVIERRLRKAIASPPRHVIVRSILLDGYFQFDPLLYYPARWGVERMLRFTWWRLPLDQSLLSDPYHTVRVFWVEGKIRIERETRAAKHDPVIRTRRDARKYLVIPSCF